jgi:hypothetical protein
MDAFSYIAIVPSIIIALGLTRLLTSLGKMFEKRQKVQTYWVHLLWSLNVFLFMVLNWWLLFRWQTQVTWNFPLFLFLLVTPTISFLLTVVLFPEPFHEPMSFQEHFYEERRSFIILAAFLPSLDFIDT